MAESGEQFLHRKDSGLQTSIPVEHEQTRRKRANEPVSQKPTDKIADFLKIIEKTHIGHKDDPRVLERIKQSYYEDYVIKPENIPQSYWDLQGEIGVREGRKQDLINAGVLIEEKTVIDQKGTQVQKRSYTFPENLREEAIHTIISDQQQSLARWIDYLTSDDATYPMWAKYWAFSSIVKIGKLEKKEDGKARFATREKDTVASFPVLNQRALANTIGAMTERLDKKGRPTEEQRAIKNLSTTLSDVEFRHPLSTEDFAHLYAQFLAEIPQYSTHGLEETRGKWVKYPQGSDPKPLVISLEGHPLEWCTANLETAKTQLQGGDFYVYYSLDEEGNPTIPRLAIRMEELRIAEPPRGIAHNQNLDPFIADADVLERKLKEFGTEGDAFKKRLADMKRLTEIEKKAQGKQNLLTEDLRFLYEIDSTIEGFGYEKDLRIEEIRSKRNAEEDMPIVFACDRNQIARGIREITPDTKAYVGPLEPGIFDLFSKHNIEHIYTSFPEGRIRRELVEIGGKDFQKMVKEFREMLNKQDNLTWQKAREILEQSKAGSIQVSPSTSQFLSVLAERQINISSYGLDMLENPNFTTLPTLQNIDTVRLTVRDLGFKGTATTDQVYARAKELGLELCPAETGPHKRLKYTDQPMGNWEFIAMKQITDRNDDPDVFYLGRRGGGLWLHDAWAYPAYPWHPEAQFVFGLRKSESQNPQTLGFFERVFKR